MDILFTGNLSSISDKFFEKIGREYKCVVAGEGYERFKTKNVLSCLGIVEDDGMGNIFSTFNFESVVFFSKSLDGFAKIFDELEKLENILNLSKQHDVKNIIYLVSNDIKSTAENEKNSSRYILMQACENLCRSFSKKAGVHVMMLYVPFLYSIENPKNHVYGWVKQAIESGSAILPGIAGSETDFLCEEDLGELIQRILDEPKMDEFCQMRLNGGNEISFAMVGSFIQKAVGDVKIKYQNYILRIPICDGDSQARKEYGWFPLHNLDDDISVLFDKIKKSIKKRRKLYERRMKLQKLKERLRVLAELLIAFLAAMLLSRWTQNNILLNFIDFRMIYVVIMGMMNGLNAGVVAALLASIGYVAENAAAMQWQIIFYNVQNWLPFACYFLLGAIAGYSRDKHDDEVVFIKEEHDILEEKYIFLNKLYTKVLENKNDFNSQIIGYQDSFGKLYGVVKKLDTMLEEEVFYEAVNVLEDMLENHSVAIYTLNNKSEFARLNVCSKSVNSELSKSMRLSDYPEIMECLHNKRMFVNTACLADYPIYVTPIYKNEELLGMILLRYADDSQMNMEFSNKFTIITDLIRDSMIRAIEYTENNAQVVDGTQILKPERFREILNVKRQMKEKDYLDYTLIKLASEGRKLQELSDIISGIVRSNDILGMGEDGEVNLLLSQTGRQGIQIIRERLEKTGIRFKVISE